MESCGCDCGKDCDCDKEVVEVDTSVEPAESTPAESTPAESTPAESKPAESKTMILIPPCCPSQSSEKFDFCQQYNAESSEAHKKSGCCSEIEKPYEDPTKPKAKGFFLSPCLRKNDSDYTMQLETEYEILQKALFSLTSHFSIIKFRLRQVLLAQPEEKDRLFMELASVALCGMEEFETEDVTRIDPVCLGNIRRQQGDIIEGLRNRMDFFNINILETVESNISNKSDKKKGSIATNKDNKKKKAAEEKLRKEEEEKIRKQIEEENIRKQEEEEEKRWPLKPVRSTTSSKSSGRSLK